MTKKEFLNYVADNVTEYLPFSYENAEVLIEQKMLKDGRNETTILIRKDQNDLEPHLRLDYAYEEYLQGADEDDLVQQIAEAHMDYKREMETSDLLRHSVRERKPKAVRPRKL